VECVFEDRKVGFVADTQVLGRGGEGEVVRGRDVRQDKRGVGDVSVVGNRFVDDLEGAVCSLLSVVRYSHQAKDDQSVCHRVRLREDRLLPGLLLALYLRELLRLLLLRYLCVGRCGAAWGFGGGGRRAGMLCGCRSPNDRGSDDGVWAGGKGGDLL